MRSFVLTLVASGLAIASTCPVPVTGLTTRLGEGVDASAVFDTASGELAIVRPDLKGDTADKLHALTALTLQTDLRQPGLAVAMGEAVEQEKPASPLSSYLAGLKDDELLALSNEQRGALKNAPSELCLLCTPGVAPSAAETLADLAAEPFEPILYAAAGLPPTAPADEPAVSAPVTTATVNMASPGGVRLAAFLIPPDMPKRNAAYFFICGGLLLLVARFRRLGRTTKSL
jgi:hypothetical protein